MAVAAARCIMNSKERVGTVACRRGGRRRASSVVRHHHTGPRTGTHICNFYLEKNISPLSRKPQVLV